MTTVVSNREVIEALNAAVIEYFETGNEAPFLSLVDPDCKVEVSGMPSTIAEMLQVFPAFRAAFSDTSVDLHEVVSEGDLVAYRITFKATHTGEFMGIPATGKQISMSETHLERIRDGKIVLHAGDIDMIGLMQQLGAIPAPA